MCRTDVVLKPLQMDDRDQFVIDNQWAFKYGSLEEFGLRNDCFEEGDEIISRKTIEDCIDKGEAYSGFHIVEFFNPMHKSPHKTDCERLEAAEDGIEELDFRFEKVMPAF